jgi:L-rhamnose mutarotase
MEHISFVLQIDPSQVEEYKRRHERVDPALEEQFAVAGIHRYHIYFHEGILFAFMEVDNFEKAMAHLSNHPANAAWQAKMADLLLVWENGQTVKMINEMYRYTTRASE